MKTLFLGDVSPTVDTYDLYKQGKLEVLFGDTKELFDKADLTMVNLECALTDAETGIDKFGPCIKGPTETAELLRALGVQYAGLSNNHIFDFGKQGVLDTVAALDAAGIVHTGFGKNEEDARRDLIVQKMGERIAVICVCEHEYSYALEDRMGSRPFDPFQTMLDIRRAKEAGAERVVVLYHGGKEQCEYPSPRLQKACRAMVAHGADLVLCQHSHCIGCYESYEGGHILYGQGNYQFVYLTAKEMPENWHDGLAVCYDTKTGEVEFVPYTEDGKGGIMLAHGEERERILSGFEKRNAELKSGAWKAGWHAFCESKAAHYTCVVERAYGPEQSDRRNHCFAHYLDCEAHTDVWREIFPTANLTNEK